MGADETVDTLETALRDATPTAVFMPFGLAPVAPPVDHGDAAKQAALAHYASQLRALEADWQLGPKLAAPAPEQFWRLAPPPPGWERLSQTGESA